MKTVNLTRILTFRPHDDDLLANAAHFWLNLAGILVAIMAVVEGISWGYLGYLFGSGMGRWICAAFSGAIIFVVIWILDASLMTWDRAAAEHTEKLLGEQQGSPKSRVLRQLSAFGVRIVLMFGSMSISAPYLTMAVLHTDIDHLEAEQGEAAVHNARQAILNRYQAAIIDKADEIKEKQSEYEAETAGTGASKRYGFGSAAKAKLDGVKKLEQDRVGLERQQASALADFDRLSRDWHTNSRLLSQIYQVTLPDNSVLQARRSLAELERRPEYIQTEWAIKAFLLFVFGALILLKMFEPHSVCLYLSEVLQQEFGRYRSGIFDHLLPASERSTNPSYKMTAQRFYSFLLDTWRPLVQSEQESRAALKKNRMLNDAKQERERHYTEERARLEFENQQRIMEERHQREKEAARREDERRLKITTTNDRLEVSEKTIQTSKRALDTLIEQEQKASLEFDRLEEIQQNCIAIADAASISLHELDETIRITKQDIEYFDQQLDLHEKQKASLDEKGAADIACIQAKLREKRGDANQGLVDLQQARSKEDQSLLRAADNSKQAEMRAQAAANRRDQLRAQIAKLEDEISREALAAASIMLGA